MKESLKGDPIFTFQEVADKIILDNEHKFDVLISIGLNQHRDYYLKIVFQVEMERYRLIRELFEVKRALVFESELCKKQGYDITHIVATNLSANSVGLMMWECLSDKPFSLVLDKLQVVSLVHFQTLQTSLLTELVPGFP